MEAKNLSWSDPLIVMLWVFGWAAYVLVSCIFNLERKIPRLFLFTPFLS